MEETSVNSKKFIFNYPWALVMKAFWLKYPHQEQSYIGKKQVIDMNIDYETKKLAIKRIYQVKKMKIFWVYFVEDISIDLENKTSELHTFPVMKSRVYSIVQGEERISYKDLGNNCTEYSKKVLSNSKMKAIFDKISENFKVGIRIVEERCEQLKDKFKKDK